MLNSLLFSPKKTTLQEFLTFACMMEHFCRIRDREGETITEDDVCRCIFKCIILTIPKDYDTKDNHVLFTTESAVNDVVNQVFSDFADDKLRSNVYCGLLLFLERICKKTGSPSSSFLHHNTEFIEALSCTELNRSVNTTNASFSRLENMKMENKRIKTYMKDKLNHISIHPVKKERPSLVKEENGHYLDQFVQVEDAFEHLFFDVADELSSNSCHHEENSRIHRVRTTTTTADTRGKKIRKEYKNSNCKTFYQFPVTMCSEDMFSFVSYLLNRESLQKNQESFLLDYVERNTFTCNCCVSSSKCEEEDVEISGKFIHCKKNTKEDHNKYVVIDLHLQAVYMTFQRHGIKWHDTVKLALALEPKTTSKGKETPRCCLVVYEKDWCRLNMKWMTYLARSTPLYPVWCKHIVGRSQDLAFDDFRYYYVLKSMLRYMDEEATSNEKFIVSPEIDKKRFRVYDLLFFLIDKCVSHDGRLSRGRLQDIHDAVQSPILEGSLVQAVRDFILIDKVHVIKKKVLDTFYGWFICGEHDNSIRVREEFSSLVEFMKNIHECHMNVDMEYFLFDNYSLLNKFDTKSVPLKSNRASTDALVSYYELCSSVFLNATEARTLFTAMGTINKRTLKPIVSRFPLRENSLFLKTAKENWKHKSNAILRALLSMEEEEEEEGEKNKGKNDDKNNMKNDYDNYQDYNIKPDGMKVRSMSKMERRRRKTYTECINETWENAMELPNGTTYLEFQKTGYKFFRPIRLKDMYRKENLPWFFSTVIFTMVHFLAFLEFLGTGDRNVKIHEKILNVQFGRPFYSECLIRKHDIHVSTNKSVNLKNAERLSAVLSRRGCNSEWMRSNIATDEDVFVCNVEDEKDSEVFFSTATSFHRKIAEMWFHIEGLLKKYLRRERNDKSVKRKERSFQAFEENSKKLKITSN